MNELTGLLQSLRDMPLGAWLKSVDRLALIDYLEERGDERAMRVRQVEKRVIWLGLSDTTTVLSGHVFFDYGVVRNPLRLEYLHVSDSIERLTIFNRQPGTMLSTTKIYPHQDLRWIKLSAYLVRGALTVSLSLKDSTVPRTAIGASFWLSRHTWEKSSKFHVLSQFPECDMGEAIASPWRKPIYIRE